MKEPGMKEAPPSPGTAIWKRIEAPILWLGLGLLFLLLLRLTWRGWGDPVIDTGRELEIPWKIAEGAVLYRDAAYNYGPFSPYVNALFVLLFGARYLAVAAGGMAAAAGGAALVYRVCRLFLSRPGSAVMTAVFLFECAFQHYYMNGNFNFILPYSFPAVHATLAALGAFLLLSRYLEQGSLPILAGAGVLAGTALLCKVEIAAALIVPLAAAPLLRLRAGGGAYTLRKLGRATGAWALPAIGFTIAGFAPFTAAASFHRVVWENVLKPQLTDFRSNVFFMEHLGLENLEANLEAMILSLGAWAGLAAVLAWAARFLDGKDGAARPTRGRVAAAGLTAAAGGAAFCGLVDFEIAFRLLPVLCLAVGAWSGAGLLARRMSPAERLLRARLLLLSLFAFLALFRILFTAGTFHYGFCLALPGVVLLGVFLAAILPRWVPPLRRHPRFAAGAALGVLLALSAWHFDTVSLPFYRMKTVVLRGPGGSMRIFDGPWGNGIRSALDHLNRAGKPGDTLLVLPEGAVMNVLTRQPNPTYYDLFIPPELNAPGVEDRVIREIDEKKVTRILLIDRDVREYGRRGLGVDYGRKLMDYVAAHYVKEAAFGPRPYNGRVPGGCWIFRRKEGRDG